MPGYSVEALERGIEQAKKNIRTFEGAIEKERATIQEYYGYIETINRKASEKAKEIIIKVGEDVH